MKQIIFVSLFLVASVFALPFIFMTEPPLLTGQALNLPSVSPVAQEPHSKTSIISTSATPASAAPDGEIAVRTEIDGQESEMSLEAYMRGVLLGEMPSSFPPEAIKAQAVAIRTLVMRSPGTVFCGDPAHCMAYVEPTAVYPKVFDEAIAQTAGKFLTYEGEPALAVFFSTSSGQTECSADVWGGALPYLSAVDSPGEGGAPNYRGAVTVLASDFWETLRKEYPDATEKGEPFGAFTRTASGGVKTVEVSGVPVPGTDMRRMFGLNSTNFTASKVDGNIVFETLGFGHGVGMPQYGARAMALNGADYKEILAHYYPGTVLVG